APLSGALVPVFEFFRIFQPLRFFALFTRSGERLEDSAGVQQGGLDDVHAALSDLAMQRRADVELHRYDVVRTRARSSRSARSRLSRKSSSLQAEEFSR